MYQMPTIVEVTLHYGGKMYFNGVVPRYVAGRTKTITTDKEHMSYIGTRTWSVCDNEDLYGGRNEEEPHLDSLTADSVAQKFIHLVDDDSRTTDDKFEEALYHMGIRSTRRRVAYMGYSSGEEVEKLEASAIRLGE
ncbi:hypothetical protein LINPERHAP2_LOCUS3272 [Linum perenne]